MIAGVRPIKINLDQNVQTYMATKINNLEYNAKLEVRNWRQSAEIAIAHEGENGTMYGVEVYTDGNKIGDSVSAAGVIFLKASWYNNLSLNCMDTACKVWNITV